MKLKHKYGIVVVISLFLFLGVAPTISNASGYYAGNVKLIVDIMGSHDGDESNLRQDSGSVVFTGTIYWSIFSNSYPWIEMWTPSSNEYTNNWLHINIDKLIGEGSIMVFYKEGGSKEIPLRNGAYNYQLSPNKRVLRIIISSVGLFVTGYRIKRLQVHYVLP